MFVGLGFLIASFLVVLLAPAYRARTMRLTAERVRAALPVTEAELRADKDRIRADSALRIHRLESELEGLKLGAARQQVEVNRRDGQINTLTSELTEMRAVLEGAQNARNVLEQTIADRLPKVEQRLIEAKKLLFQRDREIANLTQEAQRTQAALTEAVQINAQKQGEVERLSMVLETRAAQNRDGLADPTFDTEVALRSELEALRARTRDQAAAIEQLRGGMPDPAALAEAASRDDESLPEVVRLQRDLMRAETALKAMKDVAETGKVEQVEREAALRQRDQKIDDQQQEIARLTAALAAYEDDKTGNTANRALSLKDSRIAMKSKLASLQSLSDRQAESIRKLRSELAASNERLARQAQHFMEEMRRLGAGTLPASTQPRRAQAAAERRSLRQRITEVKPELAHGMPAASRPVLVKTDQPAPAAVVSEPVCVNGAANGIERPAVEPAANAAAATPESRSVAGGRPRLMDRITDFSKT